jgi:hypothetical protein
VAQGKVVMHNNLVLSQEEIDDGWMLACQAETDAPLLDIRFDPLPTRWLSSRLPGFPGENKPEPALRRLAVITIAGLAGLGAAAYVRPVLAGGCHAGGIGACRLCCCCCWIHGAPSGSAMPGLICWR